MIAQPPSLTQRARHREFRSAPTPEFLALFCVNLAIAASIIYYGMDINHTWPGRGNLFLLAGFGVVGFALYLMWGSFARSVRLTPQVFVYRRGRQEYLIPWQNMRTFQMSRPGKRWFRTALVGDHLHTLALESSVFPEFDLIVSIITVARKHHREQVYEIGG